MRGSSRPTGLAVFYPHPGYNLPLGKVVGAALVLACVSLAAPVWLRRFPYPFVGWFWYLGTLVPMIGLVQIGSYAKADRFTYVTQIGLGIALAWALAELCRSRPRLRWVCRIGSALVLGALLVSAWRQTTYWRDSVALWTRDLECTERNCVAHVSLGTLLLARGHLDEVVAHYQKALEIEPGFVPAHYNLGNALANCGRFDEAIAHYRKALEIEPGFAEGHNNLGLALADRGQVDQAITHYREALRIKPDFAEAHNNFGVVLGQGGRFDEAIIHFQQALKIKPDYAEACNNLGNALAGQGRIAEAVAQWREVVRLQPNQIAFVNNLAWVLATCPKASVRNGAEAVPLAQRAVKLGNGRQPAVLDTLAAAYAEAGRFPEAVQTARKALDLATHQNRYSLAESIRAKISLYEAGIPFRQTLSTTSTP